MSPSKQSKSRAFSRSSTASPIYQIPVATRTKSHGAPRVLPLPDIPLRSSRENSRSGSPSASPRLGSPRGSGDGPFLNVTAIEMVTGRSSDGLPFGERSGNISSSSPPFQSTVITGAAMLGTMQTSRPRASTSPMQAHTRTTGFSPTVSSEAQVAETLAPDERDRATARPPSPTTLPLSSIVRSHNRPTRTGPLELAPSSTVLTDHLYASFLNGTCADVRLWVRKWNVSWMLHKMVLVQASFFRSLFMGGFSEMAGARRSWKGKERASEFDDDDWTGDDIELQFDDPNITRAAFEICLSRLYSTHPTLQIPTSLLPDAFDPLTSAFPDGAASLEDEANTLRLHAQLATPRMLLSLLATTIYLGHAPLLKEAMSMILRTISPFTVCGYLDFALDGTIGEEEWAGQDSESARHLSGVGKEVISSRNVEHLLEPGEDTPRADTPLNSVYRSEEIEGKVGGSSTSLNDSPQKAGGIPPPGHKTLSRKSSHARLPRFYGAASNKIGEAVVCWLARWAVDIINVEVALPAGINSAWSIWGCRGIPAKFVRACLCSDHLFVRDELERYMLARKILDLRRAGWERESDGTDGDISLQQSRQSSRADLDEERIAPWDEDELELGRVFAEGIYYSNMSFDDLATISADIDPYTELPYAPLDVLQSAHWAATNLRSRIQAQAQAQEGTDGELGLSRSSADIATAASRRLSSSRGRMSVSSMSGNATLQRGYDPYETIRSSTRSPMGQPSSQVFHPIVGDDSLRFGNNGVALPQIFSEQASFHTAMDESMSSLRLSDSAVPEMKPSRRIDPPQGEATSFGLENGKRNLSDFSNLTLQPAKQVASWTSSEPFRFSVEFWGVNHLADKDRLYSPLHFYAGSWWLVYLQIMRRTDKNGEPQLGIYLQRWEMSQPAPNASSPPAGAVQGGRLRRGKAEAISSLATDTRMGVERIESEDIAGSVPIVRSGSGTRSTQVESYAAASSSVIDRRASAGAGRDSEPEHDIWRRRSDTASTTLSRAPDVANAGSPPSTGSTPEARARARSGDAEYVDERQVVKAYFSVICSSALGTSLVRFNSSPDVFAQSQSWGWKSSALRSDEYLGLPLDARGRTITDFDRTGTEDGVLAWAGIRPTSSEGKSKDGSGRGNLRASVVLGVI